jgi:hypothetical protein
MIQNFEFILDVKATRYVTPLKEGGSLPAIIEADNDGMYVLKFRGAGQGVKSLIAELLGGLIGRALGLPVPELAFIHLDSAFGRNEPDPEIQSLLKASVGLNMGLDYLPGSLAFDPLHAEWLDPLLASQVVWFDAFITNVDRTPRNTNLLVWHKRLWLIDHGAALYFHHTWTDYETRARSPFTPIKDHVLLPHAARLDEADATLRPKLTTALLEEILAIIPDEWLPGDFESPAAHRAAYLRYLTTRLEAANIFVEEAAHARAKLL